MSDQIPQTPVYRELSDPLLMAHRLETRAETLRDRGLCNTIREAAAVIRDQHRQLRQG